MDKDISGILAGWDYDPRRVTARWITGKDGRPKVQLRLDLGLFQMEAEGRPDGARPHGFPSLLDYYRDLEQSLPQNHPALVLNEEACSDLQQEAVQYYYRYIAFYALGHLEGVIRDTQHNLDIMSHIERHAADPEQAWQILQFYPYVRMMHARAAAEQAEAQGSLEQAIALLEAGISDIEQFWAVHGDEEVPVGELDEMIVLQEQLRHLRGKLPVNPLQRLRDRLDLALKEEDYEQAARLRDQIRRMEAEQAVLDDSDEEV